MAATASLEDREMRKAVMQTSNWIAAEPGGAREFIPISGTPLDQSYQKSKSQTRSDYLERIETQTRIAREDQPKIAPAADVIAQKYYKPAFSNQADTTITLGYDGRSTSTSAEIVGASQKLPVEQIDLLEKVEHLRDATLDGSHRASMTEGHFLSIWDPYDSQHKVRSASFTSAVQLREAHHRHIRSQYHPHEKYELPPSVQNDMGWKLTPEKYQAACSKFQEGAHFFGRSGSHITKFAERLQLGARHHLSGPMTKPALHY